MREVFHVDRLKGRKDRVFRPPLSGSGGGDGRRGEERCGAPAFPLVCLFLACVASLLAANAMATPKGPSLLFVYTDDQRWDTIEVVQREQGERARFPWLRTPNIDRLASEGIRFRSAFVVNSLCSPSRVCFLTGPYSHFDGVANIHSTLGYRGPAEYEARFAS